MTRYLLSFLAGTVVTTGAVVYADGRAAFMFVIGVMTVVLAIAAVLSSAGRTVRIARFMLRAAGVPAAQSRIAVAPAPAAVRRAAAPVDGIPSKAVADCQSALMNFGARKAEALAIAQAAVAAGGTEPEILQRAMQLSRKAAA